jgi:Xaa-Pro aminopeptidase
VLRAGEEDAPEGLRRAFTEGGRVQDLLTARFAVGRSGNEVLRATLEAAHEAGLQPTIYTHPLGFHGHGAGPLIGLWDAQEGVPGRGDYTLRANTAYSIELGTLTTVPEWDDQEVRIMLEEDAFFDGERVRYLDGRQTELILIP